MARCRRDEQFLYMRFDDETAEAWARFPNANLVPVPPDERGEAKGYDGYCCPECQWAYAAFRGPLEDCSALVDESMLVGRVSLRDYLGRRDRRGDLAPSEAVVAERVRPYEALARDGDEWWTWVMGDEPLMQQGGLALVRLGRVVWATMEWIS
jgi:hypothetical protein